MFRIVKCTHSNGTIASEKICNRNERPTHIYQCLNRIECIKYQQYAVSPFEQIKYTGMFIYSNWSKCSVKCGLGFRTRDPSCVLNTDKSVQLPISYCNQNALEKIKIKCHLANCTYKLIEKWSSCTYQCGKRGIETLEQKCYETVTRQYLNVSLCGLKEQINRTRSCYKPCIRHLNLISFEWKTGSWSSCSAGCGFGHKNRSVYCWNNEEKTIVNETNCISKKKLISSLPCMNTTCGYGWFVSKWSPCSTNCSLGYKTREVKCIKLTKEGHIKNETSDKCSLNERPESQITCNYGNCNSLYFWKPTPWSQCSPHCGFGNQRRIIECADRNGVVQDNHLKCFQDLVPISHQLCFTNCQFC